MAVNKLEIMLELSDKLFNNALNNVQQRLDNVTNKMKAKLKSFALDAGISFIILHERIKEATNKIMANLEPFTTRFGKVFNNIKNIVSSVSSQIRGAFSSESMSNLLGAFKKLKDELQFTKGLQANETMLRQMGIPNPEEINAKAHSLEKRWGDESNNVLKTANVMSNGLGYSMEMSMGTLENFYEKGGNLNGDMLEQLQNSLPQIKQMGMSVEDYLGVMTNGAKKGMSSENTFKGLEQSISAIENLDKNKLNEITSALNINPNNLEGKSSFDILQTMLKEANDPAKKAALTSIFTETGQEAGINFMLGLGGTDVDPSNLENFKGAGDGIKDMMASVESYIADKAGGILPYLEAFSSMNDLISPFFTILTSLNQIIPITTGLTKAWAIVQGFLNGVMALNPVSLIVLAIIALVAYIAIAINYYDEWGAAMLQFLGPIGWVINAFMAIKDHWDSIVEAFKTDGIIGGLKRIHIVLMDTFLKPLQQILEIIQNFDPTGLSTKALKRINQIRFEHELVTKGEKSKLMKQGNEALLSIFTPEIQNTLNNKVNSGKRSFYTNQNKVNQSTAKSFSPPRVKEDINTVTGQANQAKRIDIKIDSFIKGGVQVSNNGQGNGMSSSDLETWFKEMFQRIIINAENATN
ncbi:phage tail tape measure protein [Empedobacter brevis]